MKTFRMGKLGWVLGGVAALSSGIVACGSDFSGDCQLSRTCPDAEGSAGAGTSEAGQPGTAGDAGSQPEPAAAGGAGESPSESTEAGGGGAPAAGTNEGGAAGSSEPAPVNPAPYVLSVAPKDGATAVETNGTVTIELSEPLAAETVNRTNVRVTLGDHEVEGTVAYADSRITFTPKDAFALLGDYDIALSTAVTDVEGAPLEQPFESSFTVRDGKWKTVDAATGKMKSLSASLSLSAGGSALLAWVGSSSKGCSVVAGWFERGVAKGPAKVLTSSDMADCSDLAVAGNAAGTAAVLWRDAAGLPGGSYAQVYANAAWLAKADVVSNDGAAYYSALSVAPDGHVAAFESNYSKGVTIRRAGEGTPWPGESVSDFAGLSHPSVAFDDQGNGFAVWRAFNDDAGVPRIVVSRLAKGSTKWSSAVDLKGAVGAPGDANQFGAPAVAVDAQGGAMVLWLDAPNGFLKASRYDATHGWTAPVLVASGLTTSLRDVPALVFDGSDFVAAWTAQGAGLKPYTYTARYSSETGWGQPGLQQTAAADGTSVARMPRLGSDGRGNLLLVWAKGSAPNYSLVYQRYTAGKWSAIQAIEGAQITDSNFEMVDVLPFAVNASGLGAVAWGNYSGTTLTAVRLASFF